MPLFRKFRTVSVSSRTRDGRQHMSLRVKNRTILSAGQDKWEDTRFLTKMLLCLAVLLIHASTEAEAHFMGGFKAVFPVGCANHWTHRSWGLLPLHTQLSVCMNIRTQTFSGWTAFTYGPLQGQHPELGMQGDRWGLAVWLRGKRYLFRVHLTPGVWHQVCLAHSAARSSLTLWVDYVPYLRKVHIPATLAPDGELALGCRAPSDHEAPLELYLFRVWDDIRQHRSCEDGNVAGWKSEEWQFQSWTAVADTELSCGQHHRAKREVSTPTGSASSLVPSSDNYTGMTQLSCTFQQFCDNNIQSYYWMTLNVTGEGSENESDVINTLSHLFNLSDCVPSSSATLRGSTSVQGMCKANSTIQWLLQDIEVTCTVKSNIRVTQCSVLLWMSSAIDTCRLVQALQQQGNQSVSATLLGKVERLGKGICPSEVTAPPDDSFVLCNFSTPISNFCQGWMNVTSCKGGYAETVYAPLTWLEPQVQSCSNNNNYASQNTCNCTAYCSGTAAYYAFLISGTSLTDTNINNMIAHLNSTVLPCIPTTNLIPLCSSFNNVSELYQDSYQNCENAAGNQVSCRVILKLAQPVGMSTFGKAMEYLCNQSNIACNGSVFRAGICTPALSSASDLLDGISSWQSEDICSTVFCALERQNNLITCQGGNQVVLFNEQSSFCSPGSPAPPVTPTALTGNGTMTPVVSLLSTATPYNTTSLGNTTQPPATVTNMTVFPGTVEQTTTSALSNTTAMTVSTTTASLETQAEELLNLTKDMSALNSSEVASLVSILERLLSGPNVSLALGSTAITIVSNLLNASVNALAQSSTGIINVVDTVGLKLELSAQTETILSDSLALAVTKVDGSHFQETSFSITDPSTVQISGGTRLKRNVGSQIPQGTIVLPASLTSNLSSTAQHLASRVQFNFYQKSTVFVDRALGNRTLNSGILGSSVANLSISHLTNDVVFTLRNNGPVPKNYTPSCVFWDFSKNSGSGGWSSSGCSLQNYTNEQTVCKCNHLTSFAVLLDISREPISPLQNEILTYITYIGCGISSIFISVTLLTYLAFEKLRRDIPSKILIQLCLALLLLNLVFLLDSWLALYPKAVGLCVSTAFFLHYFLLASFTWMGLEAFHMYLALVKVFNTYVTRYMLKFCLVGWGVPLVVVIIVIAIRPDNYGLGSYGHFPDGASDDFCWFINNTAFYVAVAAYFCLVFLLNITVFVVVLIQLCRIKRQNPHNIQHRSVLQEMRSVAGLTVLLGLTWGFGLFAWGKVNLAFMYLFSIFNSLQGFFIFVFHCAVKENVRRQWRIHLCCGRLRLPENSDWSQTATQKTARNRSRVLVTSSHSSSSTQSNNTSSTSFLPSEPADQANGISNPYDDRTITALEEPLADVVSNEVNSRYRVQHDQ